MIRPSFRPLFVTALLLVIYGGGQLTATSAAVLFVSTIITYICFAFRIQLDFEGLFRLFERLGFGTPEHFEYGGDTTDTGLTLSSQTGSVRSGDLTDMPKPIARKLRSFIDGVMRDFIESWYIQVGPTETQFMKETRRTLEFVGGEGYKRICEMDTHSTVVHLIHMFQRHLEIFNECRSAVNRKYPGIAEQDFEKCIVELYEARIVGHVATKSKGAELDYLKTLTDTLLFILVPHNAYSCQGGRFMLREILALQGFQQLVDLLTDPHFINQALLDIFEEPIPLSIIKQMWAEEMEKEEKEGKEKEEKVRQELDDVEETYDSASELDRKKSGYESVSNQEQLEDVHDTSDNYNESKFGTPKQSSTESSDETYDAFDRVLRQNQLEAKLSEPVYGSTMVKRHSGSEQGLKLPIGYKMERQNVPVYSMVKQREAQSEAADSGILSVNERQMGYNAPKFHIDTPSGEMKFLPHDFHVNQLSELSEEQLGNKYLAGESDQVSPVTKASGMSIPNLKQRTPDDLPPSWTYCPPHSDDVFRRESFYHFNNKQDHLGEQLKAKLNAIADAHDVHISSCCKLLPSASRMHCRSLPDLRGITQSMEGSVTFDVPENHDMYAHITSTKDSEKVGDSPYGTIMPYTISDSPKDKETVYAIDPLSPTCFELATLANGSENGKAEVKELPHNEEHTCGLQGAHFFHPEVQTKVPTSVEDSDSDTESFVSCGENSMLSDLDVSVESVTSSETLLASIESLGTESTTYSLYKSGKESLSKSHHTHLPTASSFDILSVGSSETDYTIMGNGEAGSIPTQATAENDFEVIEKVSNFKKHYRTPSVTTFASIAESSGNHSESNESSPSEKVKKEYSIGKQNLSKLKTIIKPSSNHSSVTNTGVKMRKDRPSFLKFFRKRTLFKQASWFRPSKQSESTDDDMAAQDNKVGSNHRKLITDTEFTPTENKNVYFKPLSPGFKDPLEISDSEETNETDTESVSDYSERSIRESKAFGSLPDHLDLLPQLSWSQDGLAADMAEEVDKEIDKDADDIFEDAKSNFELSVDMLSTDNPKHNISAQLSVINELEEDEKKGTLSRSSDHSVKEGNNAAETVKTEIIPVFKGEIIMPHPSKIPATAWLYPIQMISIPSTEVAHEKGWELAPGGNKYTLYRIHYDIRIWPEIYQHQLLEASKGHGKLDADISNEDKTIPSEGKQQPKDPHETIPVIREIKRRYREFLYLHNRLTHGPMAKNMKDILRPNRRYAMPFGRMDPDVIEGRRKILEYYLVSLISRPELCNSREFKEFLGAEGYGNVSFIKPKAIQPKMIFNKHVNKIITGIKTAFPSGQKDSVDKSESSQYFIHGYEIPRMFGYADKESSEGHMDVWLSSFLSVQCNTDLLLEGKPKNEEKQVVMATVEFHQTPKLLGSDYKDDSDNDKTDGKNVDKLGSRSPDDGVEDTDEYLHSGAKTPSEQYKSDRILPSTNLESPESPDRRFSVGIASLFSNELASRSRDEPLSALDAGKRLSGESPWPLTDAVLSLACQALKGYNSWLTYEKVQQALLYSVGGLVEWQISRAIDEVVMEERWVKYLDDLHNVIWDGDKLKEPLPEPTDEKKAEIKEEALRKLLDFIPSIVRMTIGPSAYKKWGESLIHSVQYKRINRHILYAAIEIIMSEFIPELQHDFPTYSSSLSTGPKGLDTVH